MLFTAATLSLIGAAAASPIASSGNFPPRDTGKAFTLMVNVTDLTRDLSPPVHQTFLTALHREPSRNYLGVAHNSGHPATFFLNGTDAEAARGDTRMLADLGEPGIPFSTQFAPVDGQFANQVGELNAGPSGERVTVTSQDPASIVSLSSPGLCVQTVNGEQHPVLHIFYVGNDHERIPEECVPVNLIPQCAEQVDSPEDHHLFAREVKCYDNAPAIDWSKYDAFRL